MFCSNCGNKVADGVNFCSSCGNKMSADAVNEVATPAEKANSIEILEEKYPPMREARELFDACNIEEAIECYEMVLNIYEMEDSERAEVFYILGQCYFMCYQLNDDNEKFDSAIEQYTMAIVYDEFNDKYYSARGEAYYDKWDYEVKTYDAAIEDFTKAIELRKDASYYHSRGNIYSFTVPFYIKKEEMDAIIHRKEREYLEATIRNIKEERYSAAIEDFTKAIELRGNAFDYSSRGGVYKKKEDYNAAIEDFTKAIELGGDYSDYHSCAEAYFEKGNYHDAMKYAERALELVKLNFDKSYMENILEDIKELNDKLKERIRYSTLPEEPKKRKVIVLLKHEDIADSLETEWIKSPNITVLEYPINSNSPIIENALYQSLDDKGLIESGAILVQSPYNLNVYEDAKDVENLIHSNVLRKYNIFATFCGILGATRIGSKQFESEQNSASIEGSGQAGYKLVGADFNINSELENRLSQELEMDIEYDGNPNPDIEEAKKYLLDNYVSNDEVLKSLLEDRARSGNKIKSKKISFSLTSESMQSLKLLGKIRLGFFNAEGNYASKVNTLRNLKVSLSVEFGQG